MKLFQKLFVPVACLGTIAGLCDRAEAQQCRVSNGPPQSSSRVKLQGQVRRRAPLSLDELRDIDYAVNGEYWTLDATNCPAPGFWATTEFHGIELAKKYGYVKMREVGAAAAAALLPGPEEIVILTVDEPDRFLPAVLTALRRNLRLGDSDADATRWTNLATTVDRAVRADAVRALVAKLPAEFQTEAFAPFRKLLSERRLDRLVQKFLEAEAQNQPAAVVMLLYATALVDPGGLSMVVELTKFPFIVAKRTIGGAEGTEIVVYVHEPQLGICAVYYFYLYSQHINAPIQVVGTRVINGVRQAECEELGIGEYAVGTVQQQTVDGKTDWYLQAAWTIGRIDDITNPSAAWSAFHEAVPPAYDLACDLKLEPHSPLRYLGVDLQCPRR